MKGADEFGDTVLARIDGIVERAVQQGQTDGQWGYGLSVLDDGVTRGRADSERRGRTFHRKISQSSS
jgi:hypothetical protein